MSDEKPGNRGRLWDTIHAASTVVYTILTILVVYQMKVTNDLTRRAQTLTLRPYLLAADDLTGVNFEHPGTPQEAWIVTTGVANNGALPAVDARVNAWIDDRPENVEVPVPATVERSLVPVGGAAMAQVNATKFDAMSKAKAAGCFLHLNAYYLDADGKQHKVVVTRALRYIEGKMLAWAVIATSAD